MSLVNACSHQDFTQRDFIPRPPTLVAFRFNRFVFIRIRKCDIVSRVFPCLQLYLFYPSVTHSHRSFHRSCVALDSFVFVRDVNESVETGRTLAYVNGAALERA